MSRMTQHPPLDGRTEDVSLQTRRRQREALNHSFFREFPRGSAVRQRGKVSDTCFLLICSSFLEWDELMKREARLYFNIHLYHLFFVFGMRWVDEAGDDDFILIFTCTSYFPIVSNFLTGHSQVQYWHEEMVIDSVTHSGNIFLGQQKNEKMWRRPIKFKESMCISVVIFLSVIADAKCMCCYHELSLTS